MDEGLERLINRRLDGELSEAEQAELSQRLLRDPTARQRLQDYERVDGWCREALGEALSGTSNGHELGGPSGGRRLVRSVARQWVAWAVLAAAAILVITVLLPPAAPPPTAPSTPPAVHAARAMPFDLTLSADQIAFPARPVSQGMPTHRLRYRAVDVLGIYDTQREEIVLFNWDHKQDTAKMVSYEY